MMVGTGYRGYRLWREDEEDSWKIAKGQAYEGGETAALAELPWNQALAWIDERTDAPEPDVWPPFYCNACGTRDLLEWLEPLRSQLLARWLCFTCNHFFTHASRSVDEPHTAFLSSNGVAYTIGPNRTPQPYNGYGGAWFRVSFDDGHVLYTCDLWCAGDVPEHWQLAYDLRAKVERVTDSEALRTGFAT